ncbi:chemotaxis protein CheW [Cupriavidus necator]|uniref:Chemotaxis protein CheW n=1 Tax=Cupriavidus necator TaxID=106590 RepID=A0A367PG68_CUPNE|nr:chemotaxis protein CheW [Cupriavidus necator]QQX86658.1 chemotaxis protein CheW [Cupriavidus necator]RCJ06849.1 chemotaxis protein CheW [Cupriavidus necator]
MMMSEIVDDVAFEILIFRVGREEYGVDIRKVQEIRSYETATHLANAPEYLKGVTNLRGLIVPIVDLRIKFGHLAVQYDQQTVVVVLQINRQTMGLVVDAVSDVIALSPSLIKPVPQLSEGASTEYILGLASVGERLVILVDIVAMLGADVLVDLETATV